MAKNNAPSSDNSFDIKSDKGKLNKSDMSQSKFFQSFLRTKEIFDAVNTNIPQTNKYSNARHKLPNSLKQSILQGSDEKPAFKYIYASSSLENLKKAFTKTSEARKE